MVPAHSDSAEPVRGTARRWLSFFLAGAFAVLLAGPLCAADDAPPPPEVAAIVKQFDTDQNALRQATVRKLTDLQKTLMDKGDLAGVAAVSQAILQVSGHAAASTAPGTDLKKGLVLAFHFDKDETGGKVVDASGNGNNGKAVGAKWVAAGRHGGGFEFGPTANYITVPNSPSLNPKEITLAAWIKTSYTDKVWRRIIDKGTAKGYDLTMCGDNNGRSYQGQVAIEGAKGAATSGIKVADGKWHHVAGTVSNGELKLFVDGAQVSNTVKNASIASTNFDLTIGANRSNPDGSLGEIDASFSGVMDDVVVYDRALSPDEIKALFQANP